MTGASHSIECVDLDGAEARVAPWRDLCVRASEANAFAEPAFLAPAARRLAPRGLERLFVWQDQSRRRLIGFLALEPPGLASGVARIWQSEQAGLAALVLDRDAAADALEALIDWLRRERPKVAGLYIPSLDANGATARLVEAVAHSQALASYRANPRRRAILHNARAERPGFEQALPGKRLKEWRRLRRRLEERGPLALRSAQAPGEARDAVEAFLVLETKGWKGRGGAPLGADRARAAFARSMLAAFADEGKLRIDWLELAGAPIAMGVILRSNDRAFYWKTAYDEAFADFSPGVLLTLDISRRQQEDPAVAATDSCAIEGHPMIERLWPDRLALVDCLIATRPGAGARLKIFLAQRDLARGLKEVAKRLLFPLIGRKRS